MLQAMQQSLYRALYSADLDAAITLENPHEVDPIAPIALHTTRGDRNEVELLSIFVSLIPCLPTELSCWLYREAILYLRRKEE